MKKFISLSIIIMLVVTTIVGCTSGTTKEIKKEIAFADAGWDSIKFHNAVAGLIAEKVYDYKWREVPGSTIVLHEGLLKGEVDIHMEVWTDNLTNYNKDLAEGKFKELSTNFDDNNQGIYVPRYVIEGDRERGIEALAPDLKYVWDLKKYPDVFPDDESKGKGKLYGAIPGWEVDEIMHNKYLHYGLDENFVYSRPGSAAALAAAITSAYDKGEAIAAYYWEPTWLMGKYDFVLLEDEPFDAETYKAGKSELPSVSVIIGMSNKFAESNPEIMEFLSKYQTSSLLTSEALAYMQDNNTDYIETAEWFLKENDSLLDEWLSSDNAKIIRDQLK